MGQKDVVLARYFEDPARFADLINGFLFQGAQMVSGDDVSEKSPAVTGILGRLRSKLVIQKYRDIVRRVALGMSFAVIGVEHQDQIHYAMPVRVMLEDAAGYDEQLRRIQRRHRRAGDLKAACMDEGGKIDMCEGMRQLLEDSLNEGLVKGMESGIKKGIQEGELSKTRKVARNMFRRGMSAEDTAAICEEPQELIESWFREWKR